jgi:uncharacterized phiE125 gp8 family phage protein
MSSIAKSGQDLAALPTALLTIAKSHLRVDGTYDDVYITDAIKRAINWFERVTNLSVNKVTWTWSPGSGDFCYGSARVPVSPVNSFVVTDAAAATISGNYSLETMSTHGIGLYRLIGGFVTGMKVAMPSGYADATVLDAGIADAVLRYTAHLYENREILVMGSEAATPGWMTDIISTYWMPRA